MPDGDDDDDDESELVYDDDKSKSSWGAGKITAQKSVTKRAASAYSGESSTNAKFGHRLVSADSSAAMPSGRRTVTPSSRRPAAAPSDKGHSVNTTVTRPARDGSTRTPPTSVQSTKRSRNASQNSAATRTTTAPPNKPSSEDSVLVFLMANDLSLTEDSF